MMRSNGLVVLYKAEEDLMTRVFVSSSQSQCEYVWEELRYSLLSTHK